MLWNSWSSRKSELYRAGICQIVARTALDDKVEFQVSKLNALKPELIIVCQHH